jgi:hypothetical protein
LAEEDKVRSHVAAFNFQNRNYFYKDFIKRRAGAFYG